MCSEAEVLQVPDGAQITLAPAGIVNACSSCYGVEFRCATLCHVLN